MNNQKDAKKNPLANPAVQVYGFFSLAGLGVIVFIELGNAGNVPGLLFNVALFFVGVLGIVTRFRSAPVFLLILFAISKFYFQSRFSGGIGGRSDADRFTLDPVHIMYCLAFLAYAVGQYRLQALTARIFPIDPRRPVDKDGKLGKPSRIKRSATEIGSVELLLALLTLPLCAIAAEIAWYWISRRWNIMDVSVLIYRLIVWFWYGLSKHFINVDFSEPVNRLIICCWFLLGAIFLFGALLSYWRNVTMNRDQAELILQDAVWQETRGEQRRINRWMAWSQNRDRG